MNHLTPEEIEVLVMRGDPLPDASRRHLATCPACAVRIEREARLELAIYEVAAGLDTSDEVTAGGGPAPLASRANRGARVWRIALPAAAVLLLGVVGLLGPRRDRPAALHMSPTSINALENTRVGTTGLNALLPPDTPCLRDPRTFMPGFDVVPPEPPGLRATTASFDR